MKRILCILLSLALLVGLAAGCSKNKNESPAGAPSGISGDQTPPSGTPDADPTEPAGPSLWDTTVLRYEQHSVPDAAKQTERSRAVALAPDGKQLLMSGVGEVPYLYDMDSGAIKPLYLAWAADETELRDRLREAAVRDLKKDQIDAFYEAHPELAVDSGADYFELVAKYSMRSYFRAGYAEAVEGNYLCLFDGGAWVLNGVVDCDTGAVYAPSPQTNCVGVSGGELICFKSSEFAVTLWKISDGSSRRINFGFAAAGAIIDAVGLPGGGFCAVLGDSSWDLDNQLRGFTLAVVRGDGTRSSIPLGKRAITAGYELYPVGEQFVLLQPQSPSEPCALVDLESGEVSLLEVKNNTINCVPLENCGGLDAAPVLPGYEKISDQPICRPVALLRDGKTALLFTFDGLLLFRPETREAKPLLAGEAPYATAYFGNGCDRWLLYGVMGMENTWIELITS